MKVFLKKSYTRNEVVFIFVEFSNNLRNYKFVIRDVALLDDENRYDKTYKLV